MSPVVVCRVCKVTYPETGLGGYRTLGFRKVVGVCDGCFEKNYGVVTQ